MRGGRAQSATCAILFTCVCVRTRARAYTHLFRDEGTGTKSRPKKSTLVRHTIANSLSRDQPSRRGVSLNGMQYLRRKLYPRALALNCSPRCIEIAVSSHSAGTINIFFLLRPYRRISARNPVITALAVTWRRSVTKGKWQYLTSVGDVVNSPLRLW